ncbi:MAG: type II secretion system protein [Candidatus Taylorbacteria bacterium]
MKKKFTMFRYQRQKGFTLIEMIVSLGIFSIVAVVALGALIKIISANKKAQTLQSAMTNLNYALESMSREMRMGTNFICKNEISPVINNNDQVSSCSNISNNADPTIIAFKSSYKNSKASAPKTNTCNLTYAYGFIKNGDFWDIGKVTQPNTGENCNESINKNDFSVNASILDPSVKITGYYVNVTSVSAQYPLVTIRISGYVGVRELERTYFDVQTAVAARIAND